MASITLDNAEVFGHVGETKAKKKAKAGTNFPAIPKSPVRKGDFTIFDDKQINNTTEAIRYMMEQVKADTARKDYSDAQAFYAACMSAFGSIAKVVKANNAEKANNDAKKAKQQQHAAAAA